MSSKVIALDFDGCLCENAYPEIGSPHWYVINAALSEQQNGAKLILWTCREDEYLAEAVKACAEWGLHFDAINDNLESAKAEWRNNPRKVAATEYWDDRAVKMDSTYRWKESLCTYCKHDRPLGNAEWSMWRTCGCLDCRDYNRFERKM